LSCPPHSECCARENQVTNVHTQEISHPSRQNKRVWGGGNGVIVQTCGGGVGTGGG
jgi:hypothetical protein